MSDVAGPFLVLLVWGAVLATVRGGFSRTENQLLWVSLVAHVVSVLAQVYVTLSVFDGIGDMLSYHVSGLAISHALSSDFTGQFPEVVRFLFQDPDARMAAEVYGGGNSSGTVSAISGLLSFLLGSSIYAPTMAISAAAFFGKLAIYRVVREELSDKPRALLLVAVMLTPSVVFWSSGILKESIAISGVGFMVLAAHRVLHRRYAMLAAGAAGALIVALTKPYILFAFVAAVAGWVYAHRARARGFVRIRPAYVLVAGALAVGGVVGLGKVFPSFAVDKVIETTAALQESGQEVEGGSNYQVVDTPQRSVAGQIAYIPLALASALFRPAVFDIRNALTAVNAVETTILLLLVLRIITQMPIRRAWRAVFGTPFIFFCVIFAVVLGVAVGLATTNLGTLSRYRMPLLPFFAVALVAVGARSRAPVPSRPKQKVQLLRPHSRS